MTPDEILRGPILKVERAEYHINDLNRRIQAYLGQKPFRLMTRGEPKADRQVHFIKQVIPFPTEFGLIIGDAVHNLRSSLDLAVFGMIGDKALRPESVQFPFAKREDTLVSTMKNRETELAGEKVVAEIKALKPYPGGNEWLSGLHLLDIADKHKLIIPSASMAAMSSIEFAKMLPGLTGYDTVNVLMHLRTTFNHTTKGTREARLANRRNIRVGEYERDVQPAFQIVLDVGQPFSTYEITAALVEVVRTVKSALSKITSAFLN
ncbi:MAG: hypothetical protein WA935_06570 [Sphingopyxis granuli]